MDIKLLLPCIAVFLAILIYLATKLFTIKEYDEKKRKGMFDWVSSNLTDKVYEPLIGSTEAISTILTPHGSWETADENYRRDILLFSGANFLKSAFKIREKVGIYKFHTQHDRSNEYLSELLEKIFDEFRKIIAGSGDDGGNLDESTVIKLRFLALYGEAKYFATFKALITGCFFPYDLQGESKRGEKIVEFWREEIGILEKIRQLKHCYQKRDYLSMDDSENYEFFADSVGKILNNNDCFQRWQRAKLQAYCTLFHKLLSYEMHRMYDSWYIGYKYNVNRNDLFYTIDRVFEITESKEEAARRFLESNPREKYEALFIRCKELCGEERAELETTKAILEGLGDVNPKTLNDVKKNRAGVFERIRDDKKKIENYGFIASEDEIEALYDISLDNNKLFEEIRSNRGFKGIISKITHR